MNLIVEGGTSENTDENEFQFLELAITKDIHVYITIMF